MDDGILLTFFTTAAQKGRGQRAMHDWIISSIGFLACKQLRDFYLLVPKFGNVQP
jgi:hypothetical protein